MRATRALGVQWKQNGRSCVPGTSRGRIMAGTPPSFRLLPTPVLIKVPSAPLREEEEEEEDGGVCFCVSVCYLVASDSPTK